MPASPGLVANTLQLEGQARCTDAVAAQGNHACPSNLTALTSKAPMETMDAVLIRVASHAEAKLTKALPESSSFASTQAECAEAANIIWPGGGCYQRPWKE